MNASLWRALRWLAAMRLGVVVVLIAMAISAWSVAFIPVDQRTIFQQLVAAYSVGTLLLFAALMWRPRLFYWHWSLGAVLDLLVLILLVHATGGVKVGLAPLIPVMVAGSAVPVRVRWSVSLAAAATLALLGETGLRSLEGEEFDAANFLVAGLLGAACFLAAATMSWLATKLKAQEALAEARGEDLRTQLSVTRQVISELEQGVVLLGADSRIKMLNPAAQKILSLAGGAGDSLQAPALAPGVHGQIAPIMLGESVLRHGGAWGVLREALRLQAGVIEQGVEIGLPLGTGEYRPFRVRALPVARGQPARSNNGRGENKGESKGENKGETLILIDDVQALQEQAQQLKLAAMGRLSASIAHEIRNPLGAIRHANGLLSEQLALAPSDAHLKSQGRLSKIIEDNTVRINTIVEDVLAIARRDRSQAEPIDLGRFIAGLLEEHLVHLQIRADRVKLVLLDPTPLMFDSGHLRQVLVNLVDNALRFAPNTAGAVKLEWSRNAFARLQLSIADAGPGIDAAQVEHVFEPFYTTRTQGTGLGLFLVREWCLANQSQIRYQRLNDASIYSGAFIIEPDIQ